MEKKVGFADAIARAITPRALRRYWQQRQARGTGRNRRADSDLAPIFAGIYERNAWGGEAGKFYSGYGSDDRFTEDFVRYVAAFIAERGIGSAVDLGCGDFRVGSKIAATGVDYIGVDIVAPLVARNIAEFGRPGITFRCLNIVADPLPEGDLCILRQVLQHLSNEQIGMVLAKLHAFPYALVCEHHPPESRMTGPNLDKDAGAAVRAFYGSGVFIEKPPFDVAASIVLCTPMGPSGEEVVTYLIDNRKMDSIGAP